LWVAMHGGMKARFHRPPSIQVVFLQKRIAPLFLVRQLEGCITYFFWNGHVRMPLGTEAFFWADRPFSRPSTVLLLEALLIANVQTP
jgi:hypothetical protein